MHGLHARLPKHFVLEERLERYADVIEPAPTAWRGAWAEACHPLVPGQGAASYPRVVLDLGCGKGAFAAALAASEPQTLVVAMDAEPICVAYAAQHVTEAGVPNVVVVAGDGSHLPEYFSPGELSAIYLNFPTPFPRKREAARRLTSAEHLMQYRALLAPDGTFRLRTDSLPLYRFSLEEAARAGYQLRWSSEDARADFPDEPWSEYEEKLSAQGATVYAFLATPGPAPEQLAPREPRSLVDYLPQDLADMGYVPHGMEATVVNMRNYEAKRRAKVGSPRS